MPSHHFPAHSATHPHLPRPVRYTEPSGTQRNPAEQLRTTRIIFLQPSGHPPTSCPCPSILAESIFLTHTVAPAKVLKKRKFAAPTTDAGNDSEDISRGLCILKGKNKAKTGRKSRSKLAVFESGDKDQPQPSLTVRAYLHLETISHQLACGKKPLAPIMKSSQCNPFIFSIDTSFDAFIWSVASAAKTTATNLTLPRLRWKFETPASLPMKMLTDEISFQAMLDAVQECTKGHTIFLFLPKPINLEMPPEVSSCNNHTYEYKEDPGMSTERDTMLSHKSQIDALQQDSAREVAELQHHYPIGNHPLFPDKHIYAKGGLFWDLNPVRLNVWAAAMTTQRAPASAHVLHPLPEYMPLISGGQRGSPMEVWGSSGGQKSVEFGGTPEDYVGTE
ncbi:uncharacterized protein EDB91DRAFT_1252336 [Suillus paluster]|uniref:uncharacterized protein n=1 Tax=Suillus paluster TaxID=48578 RepID=UPI001B87B54B|nr:uncharacterized protein EDB91DRAFT_1252336 [Suillus paluster]KAG1731084.1 hypothetical protein EDB91DRAFT_1252336 [Suillus paluster]